MITVFLTDEACDYLVDELQDKGLLALPDDEQITDDILIEYTETAFRVRTLKKGIVEGYVYSMRAFPPTLIEIKPERLEIREEYLSKISDHGQVQNFLDGKTEVSGIPADEDRDWLRAAVLLRRLVIPYIDELIRNGEYTPDCENSGVFFHLEGEDLIYEKVSGTDRPNLCYVRIDPDTYYLKEVPGRYYEDEIYTEEGLNLLAEEAENLPQYIKFDEDSESRELPPKITDAYRAFQLQIDGKKKEFLLAPRLVDVEFNRKDALWNRDLKTGTEHIYIDTATLLKLPDTDVPTEKIPEELLPEAVVEVTDAAFTAVMTISGDKLTNTSLSLYRRSYAYSLSPVFAEAASIRDAAKTFLGDGKLAYAGEGYMEDIAFSLLYGYRRILGILVAARWLEKYGHSDPKEGGILIEMLSESDFRIRRVFGRQRPDLIVTGEEGQVGSLRPYHQYDDENVSEEISETISASQIREAFTDPVEALKEKLSNCNDISELEQEAAKGNPYAMKLLAKKYQQGDSVIADSSKALDWYEKAAELLPEDDDIEFELFMLRME